MGGKVILVDNVLGEGAKLYFHVFISCHRCAKVEIFMSMQRYFAPGVLIVLFQRIFVVVKSAVRVVSSPG